MLVQSALLLLGVALLHRAGVSWLAATPLALLAAFAALDADVFSSVVCALRYAPSQFSGQVVWITGASSGIGAELARALSERGALLVLSARREEELQRVARSCSGPAPLVLPLDVTDMAAHEAALAAVLSRFGRLDVLVLNAGKSQRALAEHSPLALTRDIFEINFMAAVNLARVALPGMIARASGQLVVMSSIAGKIGTPVASSYSATKYALHGYFDALRSEVSQFGVRVLLACPGPVDTGIGAKAFRAPGDETAPAASEGAKMPVQRCVDLLMRAMHNREYLQEVWISQQPILALTYVNVYLPWLARALFTKVIGPSRRKALQAGGNVYDMLVMLGLKKPPAKSE